MKRILIAMLATVTIGSIFVGCTSNKPSSSSSSSSQISSSSVAPPSSSVLPIVLPALKDIHEAVKKVYGENYIPSAAIEETQLKELYGIDPDMVDEVIAEGPMISTHVDTFIAIKAKEGKGADLETALKTYHTGLMAQSMQYPMNLAKVKSAQVVRNGDYVFFTMLGAFDEREKATEEEQLKFAQDEIKKATDEIAKMFE